MSRIEVVFGGILVLAVIAAGSFVLLQNGIILPKVGGDGVFGSNERTSTVIMPAANSGDTTVFTGNYETDLCTCYEEGYSRATAHQSVESVAYRAGFSTCRGELGPQGGNAWSEGWANGADNRLAQRSCRLFLQRTITE